MWRYVLFLLLAAAGLQAQPTKQSINNSLWSIHSIEEDSLKGRFKDPTLVYFKSPSLGWEAMAEADKAFNKRDFKMVLYHLMQAQVRFEGDDDQNGICIMEFKTGALYQKWEVYERAIEHFSNSLQLCEQLKLAGSFRCVILLRLAACSQIMDRTADAVHNYKQLEATYRAESNTRGIKFTLSRLADLESQQGRYREALTHYYELAELEQQHTLSPALAASYNNIGYLYKKLGDNQNARHYFKLALEINKNNTSSTRQIISSLINIGSVYNQTGEFSTALRMLTEALEENRKLNSPGNEADLKNFIAITYFNQGAFGKALLHINQSISTSIEFGLKDVLVRCYRTKAQILEQTADFKQAAQFHQLYADLKDSINYEQRLKHQGSLLKNLAVDKVERDLRLVITDAEKNQLVMRQSALEAEREIRQKELQILQREKEIQDYSMRNQTLRLEQAEMQKERLAKDNQLRRLALERKDQQIRLENYQKVILRKENQQRLRLLEKDKRLLEQTESSHKLRIKSQRDREGLMFGLVLLSIIAGGATYLSLSKARTANLKLRVKQDETSQQNEMLGTMNRLIETKNRHITDSIKYARRIQAALLPGPEALHQALPLSLLIFRPRDVVSGDFYFLHRVPGFTYVATVDCTGHGVAGALLSMLGHQAIENLFKSGRNLMPNEMLHSIDQDMANIFKKDVSDLQKGMDIGLCMIDHAARKIHFAGAVQSLIIVSNGALSVIKGDRTSIGGQVALEDKLFTLHTVPIRGQMQCYLTSDGIASQLGGSLVRRFGSKQLHSKLLEIEQLPSATRKAEIEKSIDVWMGTEKQTDDILMVGFRPDLIS